jgi:hypothetical protein
MKTGKLPVSVLILSCLYIAVGVVGFVYYFPELMANQHDAVWIELTELLALLAGVFMLLRQNWARWLALAWMAFHVAISFPVLRQIAMHSMIFAVIAWLLLRPDAGRYFF